MPVAASSCKSHNWTLLCIVHLPSPPIALPHLPSVSSHVFLPSFEDHTPLFPLYISFLGCQTNLFYCFFPPSADAMLLFAACRAAAADWMGEYSCGTSRPTRFAVALICSALDFP